MRVVPRAFPGNGRRGNGRAARHRAQTHDDRRSLQSHERRVRGQAVDITFDTHSHEVAELLGTKPDPARLASLLALVLASWPEALLGEAREAREGEAREAREGEAREGEAREGEATDTKLVMLTGLTGLASSGLKESGLTGRSGLTGLANAQFAALVYNNRQEPAQALAAQALAAQALAAQALAPIGSGGASCANGAKWARVVSWDTEHLELLTFHVDVRKETCFFT